MLSILFKLSNIGANALINMLYSEILISVLLKNDKILSIILPNFITPSELILTLKFGNFILVSIKFLSFL